MKSNKYTPKRPNPKQLNTPLVETKFEAGNPVAKREMPIWLKDLVNLLIFFVAVLSIAWLINRFVFQSFNVVGPSMEPTLDGEITHDRLIVNRLPVSLAAIQGKQYMPSRGDIIVFKNPTHDGTMQSDEYIVKRVVGLPGERIAIKKCVLKVYNENHPKGYNPYPDFRNIPKLDGDINTCVSGDGTNVRVPAGHLFVVGDHRIGNYSMDSRDGNNRASLGTIPIGDVIGPVTMRIWPFSKFKVY